MCSKYHFLEHISPLNGTEYVLVYSLVYKYMYSMALNLVYSICEQYTHKYIHKPETNYLLFNEKT